MSSPNPIWKTNWQWL